MKAPDLTEPEDALRQLVEDDLLALEREARLERERVRKEMEGGDDRTEGEP